MNLMNIIDKKFGDKRGSYILEAAVFLPILILCVSALILIIKIVGICENICFSTAEEVLAIDLESYKYNNSVSLCNEMESRISEQNPVDFNITGFRYLYRRGEMTDLISVEGEAEFNVVNAIGIDGKINFEESLLTRGFTGTLNMGQPLDEVDFQTGGASQDVIIFPRYGTRYHRRTCFYVAERYKGEYSREMEEEDVVRKGYLPCKICGGAANAQ